MDGIRGALARIDAIRSTIEGTQPQATPSSTGASFATLLDQAMTEGTPSVPGMPSYQGTTNWLGRLGTPLTGAMGTPLTGAMGTPLTGAMGALPGRGAPAGLEAYGNGEIPAAALSRVDGTNEYLWAPAARAFELMRSAAARDGVALPMSDGYRALDQQEHLADTLGLYREGGRAAVPGTSQHGWGRAVDLELDDNALAWMRENAASYGFVEAVPREPWHWEYTG